MQIKLMENTITDQEIKAINDCLMKSMYTQGETVDLFEKKFANWNGSKYGIMVNSGSSANLLMVSMLREKLGLKDDDEVIVPSVTWPTTVYPILQNNLVPVFCDVDKSFNLDVSSFKRMISDKTEAVFLVHLLGQPAKVKEIMRICEEEGIVLIEDCCESPGAKVGGIKVGNFGIMGSYSFYFGHHMTTIEGGMIVTDDFELYDSLRSARSYGWIKDSNRRDLYPDYKNKDFVFDMLGYNLRSTDINASIGLVQLEKLDGSIKIRLNNHKYFLDMISKMNLQYQKIKINETSSFSFAIVFRDKKERDYILKNLSKKKGIESRPIVAGNLLCQPVFKSKFFKRDVTPMADLVHDCGIYLPNNQFIDYKKIHYMLDSIKDLLEEHDRSKHNNSFSPP